MSFPASAQPSNTPESAAYLLQPLDQLCQNRASGQLKATHEGVEWYVDMDLGRITFVTHTVEPLERLLSHLKHLYHSGIPLLTTEFCDQVKSLFAPQAQDAAPHDPYQILIWLVEKGHLNSDQATDVAESMTREAFEPLLCLSPVTYGFAHRSARQVPTRTFDLTRLVEDCQKRLSTWRTMGGALWSPYQRLYFVGQTTPRQRQLPEVHHKLRDRLRGITLRQLAMELGQDELALARSLVPYVREKIIYLRDPQPPYHQLPRLTEPPPPSLTLEPQSVESPSPSFTIACVDDSPTITNEIRRHLDGMGNTVVAINDPLKALMNIVRLKPDLILMDVGMPFLDGYELCRLLRRNDLFKKTPIIMVTGHTGFLDRARATMVGATDYLTKPFEAAELRRMVLRHLPTEHTAKYDR